eukprot:m51a1_g7561 hypothetical protein (101) ;mRNA; f:127994-128466
MSSEDNYQYVEQTIRQHGKPSTRYAGDTEITFGHLRELSATRIEGLQVVLKTMKRRKLVDFEDALLLKEDTVISLVGNIDQEVKADQIKYVDYKAPETRF